MLNSLSHILVICLSEFILEKSLHFCQPLVITFSQTAVTNIYFGSLQTKSH